MHPPNGPSKLIALSSKGEKKWDLVAEGRILSAPAIGANGTIYFGTGVGAEPNRSENGKFYAVNPDGTTNWDFSPEIRSVYPRGIAGSPAIGSDGTIYFGAYGFDDANGAGKFYALDSDGSKKWEFATSHRISSSPAIAEDGTIYVGSLNRMYALNPDGSKYWEIPLAVFGAPAIGADGTIYVSAIDSLSVARGGLYAIHPEGTILWKTGESAAYGSVIGIDGTIYSLGRAGGDQFWRLHAVAPDGSVRWLATSPAFGPATIAADGTIYVPDSGRFLALYPTGEQKWERGAVPPNSGPFTSAALSHEGILYTCQESGTIYAMKGSCGLANTPWPIEGRNLQRIGRASPGFPVCPCLRPLRWTRERGFQLTIIGEIGKTYAIEMGNELGVWTGWTNVTFARPIEHLADIDATNLSTRFYRAVLR